MDEPVDIEELRLRVHEYRLSQGLSLRAAAEASGVPVNTLARVEKGYLPDLSNFSRIITWLGIEPSAFLQGPSRLRSDNTTDLIKAALRRDPYLSTQAANQITEIISSLYSSLATSTAGVDIHLRAHTTFTPAAAEQLNKILELMQNSLLADDALGDTPGWSG